MQGCMAHCRELTKRLGTYSRRVVTRPALGRMCNCNAIQFQSPDELQSKLNIPGLRDQRLQTSGITLRSVRGEYLGLMLAKKGVGGPKIGAIQDVEKLGPELH